MKVPHLLRDLSRYLVGSDRVLVRLFPEAKIEAGKGEREGDSKPHAQQDKHGGKGDGPGRVHPPNEEVEQETSPKDYSRVKGCRLQAEIKQ